MSKQAKEDNKTKALYTRYNKFWEDFTKERPIETMSVSYIVGYFNWLNERYEVVKSLWQYHSALSSYLLEKYTMDMRNINGYKVIKDCITNIQKEMKFSQADALPGDVCPNVLMNYPEESN